MFLFTLEKQSKKAITFWTATWGNASIEAQHVCPLTYCKTGLAKLGSDKERT